MLYYYYYCYSSIITRNRNLYFTDNELNAANQFCGTHLMTTVEDCQCVRVCAHTRVCRLFVPRVQSVSLEVIPTLGSNNTYTADSAASAATGANSLSPLSPLPQPTFVMDMMDSDANTVLHSVTKGVHVGPPPVWPGMDNVTNSSMFDESNLPYDMKFNEGHVVAIVTYSILMVVSAIGNITVLTIILKRRRKAGTRIHAMLMHLAIADLLVRDHARSIGCQWLFRLDSNIIIFREI